MRRTQQHLDAQTSANLEIYLAHSTPAKYVGTVEAADADAAIKVAFTELNIAESQAKRLLIAVRRA